MCLRSSGGIQEPRPLPSPPRPRRRPIWEASGSVSSSHEFLSFRSALFSDSESIPKDSKFRPLSSGCVLVDNTRQFSLLLLSPLPLPRWKSGELLPGKTAVPLIRGGLPFHRQAGEIDRRLVGVDQGYPARLRNSIGAVPSSWMMERLNSWRSGLVNELLFVQSRSLC